MKRRKLISSLLALALTLGLAVPAFATDTTLDAANPSTEITVGTELNVPTISVTIAPLANMVINPYKLEYTGTTSKDSLITVPALITNASGVGIKITAKPYISKANGVTIVETKSQAESATTDPTAFMEFMFATAVSSKDDIATTGASWDADGSGVTLKSSSTGDGVSPATLQLAKATDDTTPTYGAYKISGATGGKTWTDENKFEVKILFDIEPVVGTGT